MDKAGDSCSHAISNMTALKQGVFGDEVQMPRTLLHFPIIRFDSLFGRIGGHPIQALRAEQPPPLCRATPNRFDLTG